MPEVKLLIDGVDKSAYLEPQSFIRTAVMANPIDRLSCTLVDHDGGLGNLAAGVDVVVEKADDATIRYFGGILSRINERARGLRREVRIESQDWTILLDRAYVTGQFLSATYPTDKSLIQKLFLEGTRNPMTQVAIDVFDVDTYVTASARTIPKMVVNRTPLNQAMNVIAANAVYEWYIDYFRRLHYYSPDTELSAIHLSDAPDGVTTFSYSGLERDVDGIELANYIEVVGGFTVSDPALEYIVGDATKVELGTAYIWLALVDENLPQVWRNDGTFGVPSWTQLTVFKDGDSSYGGGANEVKWSAFQKVLTFGSAPPNLANAVRVNGRFATRVHWSFPMQDSFDELGRWYKVKVVDPNILSTDAARRRASLEALRRRFGITTYRLRTQQDGFYAGQRVQLTSSLFGLSAEEYVIERNVMRLLGGTLAEYDLTLRRAWNA